MLLHLMLRLRLRLRQLLLLILLRVRPLLLMLPIMRLLRLRLLLLLLLMRTTRLLRLLRLMLMRLQLLMLRLMAPRLLILLLRLRLLLLIMMIMLAIMPMRLVLLLARLLPCVAHFLLPALSADQRDISRRRKSCHTKAKAGSARTSQMQVELKRPPDLPAARSKWLVSCIWRTKFQQATFKPSAMLTTTRILWRLSGLGSVTLVDAPKTWPGTS